MTSVDAEKAFNKSAILKIPSMEGKFADAGTSLPTETLPCIAFKPEAVGHGRPHPGCCLTRCWRPPQARQAEGPASKRRDKN